MATITEVAARAGVGVGTVSRVLNGHAHVAQATRARVRRAIAELEYRPSTRARHLSTGRTHAIGVLAPFIVTPSVVERLRGIVETTAGTPYGLVMFSASTPAERAECYERVLADDRVDGWVVLSLPAREDERAALETTQTPVVLVDVQRGDGLPGVFVDDVAGGRLVAEHLVALGHERIAFLGDDPHPDFGFSSAQRRLAGFTEALAAAGRPHEPALLRTGPYGRDTARALAAELLGDADPPTAIFAASDEQALGVLEAAAAAGIPVPDALSVVGFDDVELARWAGLTTVRQRLRDSGARGAELLLELLSDVPPAERPPREELRLELVVRRTTGPPPPRPHQEAP
jgi:LacI family transcriptional regulator